MIKFTPNAINKILEFMKSNPADGRVLRVSIAGRTSQYYNYAFALDEEKNRRPDDVTVDEGGFRTLIDASSARKMAGATVDWVETVSGSGFVVSNPNPVTTDHADPKAKKIQELFDNEINPALAMHGGFVELIELDGDRAYIRMAGGCQGCGMKDVTLKQGIEMRMMELVPEIHEVIDTTDHTEGSNPYYQSGH